MKYDVPKVIAEIGCNHKGDIKIAKKLIKTAYECGVDVVKFQKRSNKDLLTSEQYNSPHPNPMHSYGDSYGAHREFLEFNIKQHLELKKYADNLGLTYSSSVWDVKSAKEIISINPDFIKVPSACNNHFDMLQVLSDEYNGDIHISLGMTTSKEEDLLIDFFAKKNQLSRLVVYACTSGYPVCFDDVCMLEILRLKDKLESEVSAIGFSGHHLGIAVDIAAYTLGASWIERHFTLDRTWKGTDHSASLETTGLKKLSRDLKATYKSLTYKKSDLLPIELPQRDKLKFQK
jgi:N-acetylneuraminate synthase